MRNLEKETYVDLLAELLYYFLFIFIFEYSGTQNWQEQTAHTLLSFRIIFALRDL
jgi:hypothetical protein